MKLLEEPAEDLSDSSEELRYGPGIVNKLKTKYMSMTLRDNQKKCGRPSLSNLRKATSLDNLLDDGMLDANSYQISSVVSCRVNKFEYSSKESAARVSVNFCADLKRACSMETLQEPLVPKENGASKAHDEEKRRDDKELPPPDLVKETLKIFENCQQKSNGWKCPKETKKKVASCGKPVLYPKPVIVSSVESKKVIKSAPVVENGVERKVNGVEAPGRSSLASIKVNFESKVESPRSGAPFAANESAKTAQILAASPEKVLLNGNAKKVRENGLGKGCRDENRPRSDILKPLDALPVRQVGIIRPLVSSKSTATILSTTVSSLTPQEIEKNYINAQKNLDAEKLNVEKECEKFALPHKGEKIGDSPPNGVTKPSTLWCKKPWNQQQNTMVFNFRDRKDVPDYIENDGLLLTPNRDRAKRILQETGGTGYIILGVENGLDDSINESSTDSPTISCKEEWQLISGPPSPCNVHFEGDNIVINGKSNLRKHPKDKKLRIQFNDTSTTFEYPSEASLLEDDFQNISTSSEQSFSSSSDMVNVPCSSPKVSPLSGSSLASYVPSKLSLGDSFELGVTKTNCSSNVASTKPNLQNGGGDCVDGPVNGGDQVENSDYLKPAAENDNVAWSEESIPDLLF